MLLIPILGALSWISVDTTWGGVVHAFVVAFCTVGIFTNQIHQWAHVVSPPALVRGLQKCGLILNREAHQQHHIRPHDVNYCIATGWCNAPLSAINFFGRLEWLIHRLTGWRPRQDDFAFLEKV